MKRNCDNYLSQENDYIEEIVDEAEENLAKLKLLISVLKHPKHWSS